MAIGRADHPEGIGVDPQPRLQRQPAQQRRAGVGTGIHVGRAGGGERQVAELPPLHPEACHLVIGREEGVGLAIALDLGNLDHRLGRSAPCGIFGGHGRAVGHGHLEHQPVRDIRIVRDGQHLAAGLLFIAGHVVPQLLDRRVDPLDRQGLTGTVAAVAEHDDTVEIVAVRHQRPFEPGKSGEHARLIVTVEQAELGIPDILGAFAGHLGIAQGCGQGPVGSRGDQFRHGALRPFGPFVHHVVPAQHGLVADHPLHVPARRIIEPPGRAEAVRVVGNHQKIERAVELRLAAGGGGDFLAAREPQRLLRPEPHAEAEGVDRIVGVQMGVAPVGPVGKLGELDRVLAIAGLGRIKRPLAAASGQCQCNQARRSQPIPCLAHGLSLLVSRVRLFAGSSAFVKRRVCGEAMPNVRSGTPLRRAGCAFHG